MKATQIEHMFNIKTLYLSLSMVLDGFTERFSKVLEMRLYLNHTQYTYDTHIGVNKSEP